MTSATLGFIGLLLLAATICVSRSENIGSPFRSTDGKVFEQTDRLHLSLIGLSGADDPESSATSIKYELPESGFGEIRLFHKDKGYDILVSKCKATAIWIYGETGSVKWAAVAKSDAKNQTIDVRTLARIRNALALEIGQRAFLMLEDGRVVQLMVLNIRYVPYFYIGENDQLEVKYKIYDQDDWFIEPL